MKILRLRLQNLNSLRGDHEIDFASEPIAGAGLFSITGPTGAGKSTLLDAITLALYGRAARYASVPNPADMMSRHTGECRAEVEFEVGGERYRAEWLLHRAKHKPDGRVQPPRRFVYDAAGTVLADKLRDADEVIEQLTGLDHDRFMRSVMLAQGEFARFLKADDDARAALLERLTNTGVYSQLGRAAYEELAKRRAQLDNREIELGLIEPLEEKPRAEAEGKARTLGAAISERRRQLRRDGERIARADGLARQLRSEAALLKEAEALAGQRRAQRETLEMLERHRAAEPFLVELGKLDVATGRSARAGRAAEQAKAAVEEAGARRGQVLAAAEITATALVDKRNAEVDRCRQRETAAARERDQSAQWLSEHEADAGVARELPRLSAALEALSSARREVKRTSGEIEKRERERAAELRRRAEAAEAARAAGVDAGNHAKSLRRQQAELVRLLAGARAAIPKLEDARAVADRHLRSAEKLVDALRKRIADARVIAGLKEQRRALRDGEPCPLCGATEHPFCGDAPPAAAGELEDELAEAQRAAATARDDRDRRAGELADHQAALKAGERALGETTESPDAVEPLLDAGPAIESALARRDALRSQSAEAEAQRTRLAGIASAREEGLEKLDEALAVAKRDAELAAGQQREQARALAGSLEPLGMEVPEAGAETAMRERLGGRAERHASQLARQKAAVEELAESQSRERELKEKLAALRKRAGKLAELRAESRTTGPGALRFDDLDSAVDAYQQADKAFGKATTSQRELRRAAKDAGAELGRIEDSLRSRLGDSPFEDIAALRAAALPDKRVAALAALANELAEAGQRNRGALQECRREIETLRASSVLEGAALAAAREAHAALEELNVAEGKALAAVEETLRRDDQAITKRRQLGAELAGERERLKVWEQLAGLVGSADGKRFRVFAQGLTLEVLLSHANDHMRRLSDRYHLARAAGEPLGLEIVDLLQASTRRPMGSLSGGESFLASLALALGLSDLAGRNVQIDSLFIDEGFGTLDADTLDTAIAALESLRVQDKTVGVISHIELLKERIPVRISVEARSGGDSRIRVVG